MHFARAWGLAIYKSDTLAEMRRAQRLVAATLDVEIGLHIEYCRGWGLSEAAMAGEPEALETIAYTRFVLDRGLAGDRLDLEVALAPCIVGYAEIAAERMADPATRRDRQPLSRMARHVCRRRIPEPRPRGRGGARRAVCPARRRGPLSRCWPPVLPPPPGSKPISGRWALMPPCRVISTSPALRPSHRIVVAMSGGVDFVGDRGPAGRAPGSRSSASRCSSMTMARRRGERAPAAPGRMCAMRRASPSGSASRITCSITRRGFARGHRGFRRQLSPRRDAGPVHPLQRAHQVPRPAWRPRASSAPARWPPAIMRAACRGRRGPSCTAPATWRATRAISSLRTTPAELDFLRFPLGALGKDETRALARASAFRSPTSPTARTSALSRRGSYAALVDRLRPEAGEPGDIVDVTGRCSGRIGASPISRSASGRGWGSPPRSPSMCFGSNPRRGESWSAQARRSARPASRSPSSIGSGPRHGAGMPVAAKLRSAQPPVPATLHPGRRRQAELVLDAPAGAVAPGQAAVLYDGERVLGGGWILRSAAAAAA